MPTWLNQIASRTRPAGNSGITNRQFRFPANDPNTLTPGTQGPITDPAGGGIQQYNFPRQTTQANTSPRMPRQRPAQMNLSALLSAIGALGSRPRRVY